MGVKWTGYLLVAIAITCGCIIGAYYQSWSTNTKLAMAAVLLVDIFVLVFWGLWWEDKLKQLKKLTVKLPSTHQHEAEPIPQRRDSFEQKEGQPDWWHNPVDRRRLMETTSVPRAVNPALARLVE